MLHIHAYIPIYIYNIVCYNTVPFTLSEHRLDRLDYNKCCSYINRMQLV